ncbi:MAG: hypothetical protein JWN49_129 [Parcubacteria group bacterium]|nr:hypothetical protein [Parcubacteria group bacterium]
MRIDIVGLPASGKSTLAVSISNKFSIKHIHLDEFWFEAGGMQGRRVTPNIEEVHIKVREKVEEALAADSWVSDGTYLHVQDLLAKRADQIVFLDIPLWIRLARHAKRIFFEPKRHAHLTLWDDLTFFRELIRRNFSSGPKLRNFITEHQDKVIILRSNTDVLKYQKSLGL